MLKIMERSRYQNTIPESNVRDLAYPNEISYAGAYYIDLKCKNIVRIFSA